MNTKVLFCNVIFVEIKCFTGLSISWRSGRVEPCLTAHVQCLLPFLRWVAVSRATCKGHPRNFDTDLLQVLPVYLSVRCFRHSWTYSLRQARTSDYEPTFKPFPTFFLSVLISFSFYLCLTHSFSFTVYPRFFSRRLSHASSFVGAASFIVLFLYLDIKPNETNAVCKNIFST